MLHVGTLHVQHRTEYQTLVRGEIEPAYSLRERRDIMRNKNAEYKLKMKQNLKVIKRTALQQRVLEYITTRKVRKIKTR